MGASDGLVRLPGAPAGIPDLSLIVPRDRWIPVYHIGSGGCRKVAFYVTRRLGPTEPLRASVVRLEDGTTPEPGSDIVCSTCGKAVKAEGKALALSYEKPPEPKLVAPPGVNGKAKRPKNLRKMLREGKKGEE